MLAKYWLIIIANYNQYKSKLLHIVHSKQTRKLLSPANNSNVLPPNKLLNCLHTPAKQSLSQRMRQREKLNNKKKEISITAFKEAVTQSTKAALHHAVANKRQRNFCAHMQDQVREERNSASLSFRNCRLDAIIVASIFIWGPLSCGGGIVLPRRRASNNPLSARGER